MARDMREILADVVASRPAMQIENVNTNGDVSFLTGLTDIGLRRSDIDNPFVMSRFFVNFIGELIVRSHIDKFSEILTGLDAKLYDKIILSSRHTDFGMGVDNDKNIVRFMMHISLVQQILSEDFDRIIADDWENPEDDEQPNSEESHSSEEPNV